MPSEICRLSCLVVQLLIFLVTLTRAGETIHVNNSAKSSSEIMASSWAIKIPVRDGISDRELQEVAKTIAEETGLSYHGQIGGLRGHFMLVHETFYRESGYNGSEVVNVMKKISQVLERHPEVEWSEQEIVRERFKRSLRFKDQYFPSQWHLNNLQFVGHDTNVTGVWEHNITGYGVVVAIVDDGVEWTNPDISENYSFEGSWDLNSNDADPMPRADDVGLNHHGTRCAGEIAAVANTYCAVGVAYGAKVAGIRILDGPMTDSLEAMAFNMNSQINDIYSCSWGPDDNGKTVDGPHQLAQAALAHGVRVGRRGLGSIYVVASGNGGHYKDNCNFDGYANSIYTVTIGAVDESGQMPYYAEHCASMLASTYSSGQGPLRNIVTTDWRLGSGTGCTNRHTGTSAAAPLAAGMLALVLQVRQCLSWRDIQHLIVYAAVKHNVDILDYFTNGAGFHHSHKYGFGLMDSWRLVNLASVWKPVPWMTSWSSPVIYVAKYIPLTTNQLVETYTVKQSELIELATLEHVTLTVNIEHKYRGSVLVSLVSPAGTESKLATERQQDRSSDGFVDWTFSTVRCWGEQASGTWQIIVVNSGLDDDSQGYLRNWRLTLYGSSMTPQEVKERRRLAQDSFNGLHLNSNDTGTCLQSLSPEKKSFFTDRLLTILLLISGFCVLLSVYYMLDVICGTEESPQGSGGLENSEEERKATSGQEETSLNSVLSSDSSLSSLSPVYKKLKADDATRLSHILELGQSFRHQSPNETRSSSRDIDAVSKQSVEKSRTLNVEDEREFEQRLQYAMEQSLVLQETQLKDIERLQEELGKNERVAQPHGITKDRSNIVEKLHKPLKGILKKSSRATKVSK